MNDSNKKIQVDYTLKMKGNKVRQSEVDLKPEEGYGTSSLYCLLLRTLVVMKTQTSAVTETRTLSVHFFVIAQSSKPAFVPARVLQLKSNTFFCNSCYLSW